MKIRKLVTSLLSSFGLLLVALVPANGQHATESKELAPAYVRYVFLSQRPLTKAELKQFDDMFGLTLAVRMRLSNEGKNPIYYLAIRNDAIRPHGYQLFRKLGASTWESVQPTRGREGLPGSEFTGSRYTYLMLPPNAAVEFEMFDWNNPSQEHAFTTFIKVDAEAKPVELMSDTFRPTANK